MGVRFFSTKDRPIHLGPYPLERLKRVEHALDLSNVPATHPLDFRKLDTPHSLVNAMGEYQAMMDVIRDGLVNSELAAAPTDPVERSKHLKSFGYFQDASIEASMASTALFERMSVHVSMRNGDLAYTCRSYPN